jgi:hypothetical protein
MCYSSANFNGCFRLKGKSHKSLRLSCLQSMCFLNFNLGGGAAASYLCLNPPHMISHHNTWNFNADFFLDGCAIECDRHFKIQITRFFHCLFIFPAIYLETKEEALDRTLENSLWNRLRTCRKTDYRMNE